FCSARRPSAAEIAARLAASDSSRESTRPGSSPRARWEARTESGFSRSILRSITAATLLSGVDREHAEVIGPVTEAQPRNVTTASLVTASGAPVTIERMSEAPTLEHTLAAEAETRPRSARWWRTLQAGSTRRALLLTALGGLLIAGLITALPQTEGNGL